MFVLLPTVDGNIMVKYHDIRSIEDVPCTDTCIMYRIGKDIVPEPLDCSAEEAFRLISQAIEQSLHGSW